MHRQYRDCMMVAGDTYWRIFRQDCKYLLPWEFFSRPGQKRNYREEQYLVHFQFYRIHPRCRNAQFADSLAYPCFKSRRFKKTVFSQAISMYHWNSLSCSFWSCDLKNTLPRCRNSVGMDSSPTPDFGAKAGGMMTNVSYETSRIQLRATSRKQLLTQWDII